MAPLINRYQTDNEASLLDASGSLKPVQLTRPATFLGCLVASLLQIMTFAGESS